jgi:hypothetical protein
MSGNSRFYDGEAQRVRGGAVLCGKGMCEKDSRGEMFCSSERGGAVTKDRHGHVRCFGRCEPGTPAYCENTRAGSSAAGGS